MQKELLGSETAKNLMRAFAGESQARNRYTFAAGEAKRSGLYAVSEIFRFTEDGKSIRMDVNGQEREFALNEQGVMDAEQIAMGFHQANDVAQR